MLLAAIPLAAVLHRDFSLAIGELGPLYGFIAVFILGGWIVRRAGLPVADDFLQMTGLFLLVAANAALACAVLTRTALPYTDDALAAADRALGFDWPAMMAGFQSHPAVADVLAQAYLALNWEPLLAILMLCLSRSSAARYRFLTAWTICLSLTTISYPLFPAIAAFRHYRVDPAAMPTQSAAVSWQLPELMEQLRSGADSVLDAANLAGIVTMPSFHAAAAVLLLWAFWSFRKLRWPLTALNLLMFAAAVPVGGHYLVDTLAGAALALVSIQFASQVHRQRERRLPWRPRSLQPTVS